MTFEEMIDKLLDNGIQITLHKIDGIIWYDLNTGMKSHLWIAKSPFVGGDETAIYQGRYDRRGSIDTWRDLMYTAKACLHGNQYMYHAWSNLLQKEDVLKATTTTATGLLVLE